VEAINFELIPELSLGLFVKCKNFRIDMVVDKMFPINLFYYHLIEKKWYNIANYNEAVILNPLKSVCVSSMSLMFGLTFFIR
jgi:hypothetical protein